MRKKLVIALLVFSISVLSFAYTSDRMDFGNVDFGGATVTIVGWYNPLGQFQEGGRFAGRLEEAKELFNIGDIQLVEAPWGAELQEVMMSRLMAGDSEYDLWMLPHEFFVAMRSMGTLRPVNDILKDSYYDNLPTQHRVMADVMGLGGNKYTFSVFNGVLDGIVFMMFNKDLLEREGLPDPYELYLNDEWNWDTLTDIAVRATRDTNNDGEIDQFGLAEINVSAFIFANNGDYTREVDGKVVYSANMPETVEAVRKVRELRHELQVQGGTWRREVFYEGNAAFATMAGYEIDNLMQSMDDSFGYLPIPKGPHADDYVYASAIAVMVLPVNSAKPKELIALDNFLWRVDEFLENEEEAFIRRAQDAISYQVIQESVEKWRKVHLYAQILGPDWDGIWGEAFQAVMNGEKTAAAALAEIAPVAQSLLDDALNQ